MSALSGITPSLLVALGATAQNAEKHAEPIKAACAIFNIHSPEAIAALLGQCAVETIRFYRLVENLHYTTLEVLTRNFSRVRALPPAEQVKYLRNPEALANLVYSNRYGNGDVASGDGWRYIGRGLIQTTFRANYENAEKLTGRPYVSQPELLAQPSDAALSAAAYFVSKGCVGVAESGLTEANLNLITSRVNSAMLEKETRAKLALKALPLLQAANKEE